MSLSGTGTPKRRKYSRSYGLEPLAANNAAEAEYIQKRTRELTEAHKVVLPPLAKPLSVERQIPSIEEITAKNFAKYAAGISAFKLMERAAAKDRAFADARREHEQLKALAKSDHQDAQQFLERHWQLIQNNDPDAVMSALADVFGESESVAAAVDVVDDTAFIVLLAPEESLVLSRVSDIDANGHWFVRDATVREQKAFYLEMLSSQCVATIREAFWAAPALQRVNLVVVRNGTSGQDDPHQLECLGFGVALKTRLRSAMLEKGPQAILEKLAAPWSSSISAERNLRALDLSLEPELMQVIAALARF